MFGSTGKVGEEIKPIPNITPTPTATPSATPTPRIIFRNAPTNAGNSAQPQVSSQPVIYYNPPAQSNTTNTNNNNPQPQPNPTPIPQPNPTPEQGPVQNIIDSVLDLL